MRKSLLLSLTLLLFAATTIAQSLSTDVFSVGNGNLPTVGSTFNVPVNISGFPGTVRYIEPVVIFDPTVLEYVGIANKQNAAYVVTTTGSTPATGMLKLNYNNGIGQATVANGKLFDIQFIFKGGNANITFRLTPASPPSRYRTSAGVITNITSVTNGSINGGYVDNTIDGGSWNTAGDWSLGVVPNSFHNAIVANGTETTMSANGVCNNLTIQNGGKFTIPFAYTLTVGGTLLVQTGGSLIQDITRIATVERFIPSWGVTAQNLGWHFLSSPVTNQAIQPNFVPNTPGLAQDFYMWDEPTDKWINSRVDATTWNTNFNSNFVVGKGYLVSYEFDGTKQFSGILNHVDVNIPVTYTNPGGGFGVDNGWNLLGNPFSSAILNTGFTGPINTLVKIWSGNAYTDIASGGVIPAMNGFMVEATAGGTVTIPLTARSHQATSWYKNSNERILLVARNAELPVGQESVVRFDASATESFDASMDGHFLPGYAPMFYSQVGEEKLSTNTLPTHTWDLEIPFGFAKNDGNSYVIEMKENIADANVFLTDLKTGQVQNLTQNPVYNFTAASGDAVSRFVLKFSTVGVEDPSATNNGIYTYGDKLYVNNPGNGVVEVYTMTGQLVASEKTATTGLYVTSIKASTAYYLVRVISASGIRTAKVFVK
jgi:hypothetical protein